MAGVVTMVSDDSYHDLLRFSTLTPSSRRGKTGDDAGVVGGGGGGGDLHSGSHVFSARSATRPAAAAAAASSAASWAARPAAAATSQYATSSSQFHQAERLGGLPSSDSAPSESSSSSPSLEITVDFSDDERQRYFAVSHRNEQQQQQQQTDAATSSSARAAAESAAAEYTQTMTGAGAVSDANMAAMSSLIDTWSLSLKQDIMAEFGRAKMQVLHESNMRVVSQRDAQSRELLQTQHQLEQVKELLEKYKSSAAQKDGIIANLTEALGREKKKTLLQRQFCAWKLRHGEQQRQAFTAAVAAKFHKQRLARKVFDRWHSTIHGRYRLRAEEGAERKAKEVCQRLSEEYEARLHTLGEALAEARAEIARLEAHRAEYEETMKKAFMRGVCALNVEAMSMWRPDDLGGEEDYREYNAVDLHEADHHHHQHQHRSARRVRIAGTHSESQPAPPAPAPEAKPARPVGSSGSSSHTRRITRGRVDSHWKDGELQSLRRAPPSEVVVERHQPSRSVRMVP